MPTPASERGAARLHTDPGPDAEPPPRPERPAPEQTPPATDPDPDELPVPPVFPTA